MASPVNLAIKLVTELASRVKDVKTNSEECQLLGSMAHQTMRIVQQLESRQFESSVAKVLEHVSDALREVLNAVDACCNTNFFSAMVYKQNFSLKLKHAATRLDHALSQVSLVSVEMTSNLQSDLVALSSEIRYARFEERAATSHMINDLKDAFERAYAEDCKGREEVKNLVQQLVREQASTQEELQKLLEMLRGDSKEARENKERQMEFEINEVITVVAKSLKDIKYISKFTHSMKIALRCPITQDLMQDPVMVKESGMTYDRSSITEWFNQGHFEDPLTNLTLKSRELVSNDIVRTLLQSLCGESGSSSSIASNTDLQTKVATPCLQPGLYEGHGKFTLGSHTILAFQLLILEPDGNVIGYTLYEEENANDQRNSLEIGKGEWTTYTLKLVYEDQCFVFIGDCDCKVVDEYSSLRWRGKVSRRGGSGEEENDFDFLHSPPPISRMISPSPGLMQLEGVFIALQTQLKYSSTLVLRLEVDSNVDGWMWFESTSSEPKVIGRITEGSWKSNGSVSLVIQFPPKGIVPNSWPAPTNTIAIFGIDGKIEQRGSTFCSAFNGRIARKESNTKLQKDELYLTPLNNLTSLEYHDIRVISSSWTLVHTNALHRSQTTKNCNMESQPCTVLEAKFDVNIGYRQYYLYAKGWSPLHIASRDNSIGVVKELLSKGADIECRDKVGWTPLHVASSHGRKEVVKILLENGASKSITNNQGKTPLDITCSCPHQRSYDQGTINDLENILKI